MTPDLHATRQSLLDGRTSASAELERALSQAHAPALRHTFLHIDAEAARREAADPQRRHLPLAGLPVSVKDLFDVAGQTTSAGSLVLAGGPPARHDAAAVQRLRAAGASLIGRTNMVEFAFSGVGVNPHHGTPANPCDAQVERVPGGSSSGAAVSVAGGAAFIGLGSDTGGSIRVPAALCGIVGFKSTARLVPTAGTVPLSPTLDTACAMTRSVRDAVLAHEILTGAPVARTARPLAACRFAVARTTMLDGMDGTVAGAFERSLRRLHDAGARIDEIALVEIRDLGAIQSTGGFAAAESYAWHRTLLQGAADRYDPRVAARIERGAAMKAHEYLELQHARQQWMAGVQQRLVGYDAVLSPTVPIVAPPLAAVAPGSERDAEFFRVNALLLRNTSVVNMLDGCAITLPCHGPGELPVGLMLWQGALHDEALLNLAAAVEAALAAAAG